LIIGGQDHSKFAFPGHGAARSGAPRSGIVAALRVYDGPGSAAHHFVLRCARETHRRDAPDEMIALPHSAGHNFLI
jgi:hypothetical protein